MLQSAWRIAVAWLGICFYAASQPAHAVVIVAEAENLSGSEWRYNYSVENDTLDAGIEQFTIWFDRELYASLRSATSPDPDWDVLLAQPDYALPDDGFFDVLSFGPVLSLGESLSGFSVVFDFLGNGVPGSQLFEVFDPDDFGAPLFTGFTQVVTEPASVPEPAPLTLLVFGVVLVASIGARLPTSR